MFWKLQKGFSEGKNDIFVTKYWLKNSFVLGFYCQQAPAADWPVTSHHRASDGPGEKWWTMGVKPRLWREMAVNIFATLLCGLSRVRTDTNLVSSFTWLLSVNAELWLSERLKLRAAAAAAALRCGVSTTVSAVLLRSSIPSTHLKLPEESCDLVGEYSRSSGLVGLLLWFKAFVFDATIPVCVLQRQRRRSWHYGLHNSAGLCY